MHVVEEIDFETVLVRICAVSCGPVEIGESVFLGLVDGDVTLGLAFGEFRLRILSSCGGCGDSGLTRGRAISKLQSWSSG